MDIATGAMNALLPKLGELLVGEYKLHRALKGEIEELEKELKSMTAALNKVADMPADQLDQQVKIWASDVRELSYDIEDAIDTFMLKGKGHEPAKSFFKGLLDRVTILFNEAKTSHKIHNIIKDITSQVKKASERHDRCRVDGITARQDIVNVDPRLEAMFRKATELVGIGQPKYAIAKRLLEHDSSSKQQPNIISIVGFGGLGKTTLCNSLLQDLESNFEHHFFVSVSVNPDIKKIFKNILFQLDNNKYSHIDEAWEIMQLINEIRGFLENTRFLCVIDDVWKESAWETIKLAVQDGKHDSKIIITTRNRAVAEHIGGFVYDMKPLSDDDSRNLLCKRIFGSFDNCPDDLNEVIKKILKKCGGVPLSIITIASLLANKARHPQEWEKVNKSISYGLGDSFDVAKMRQILSLSYNDLPFHLKTCVLSLSKYPEDEVIRKDVLIWSWIAEGFIKEETRPTGRSLQEIGESYFNDLINRSLIQPVEDDPFAPREGGHVYACRVHDMVLELINQLAAEEDFVTTYLSDGQLAYTRTCTVQKKNIRRLSLHNSNKSYASSEAREQLSKLRSLTVFGGVDSVVLPMSRFCVLRVLQLEDCSRMHKNHLSGLGSLRLLRFLRLRNYATELPESIGKLGSLETLDIRSEGWSEHEVLLPTSFVQLRKLVRLFAGILKLPQGLTLGDIASLRELHLHYNPEIKEVGVGDLKELRTLRIVFRLKDVTKGLLESIMTSLGRCTNLQDLDLKVESSAACYGVDIEQVPWGLQKLECSCMAMKVFPRWINSSTLSCVTTLSIGLKGGCLLPPQLEHLAQLPSLRFLRLALFHFGETMPRKLIIHSGAHAFQCLRDFVLLSGSVMPSFQPGAMPQLQRLYFWIVKEIERDDLHDLGLQNLGSLGHVTIRHFGRRGVTKTDFMEALRDHPNHPWTEFR